MSGGAGVGAPPPSTMRAWQYSTFGGGASALQLAASVPMPRAGAGELVVRVDAASVNPVDWKIQSGILRPLLPPRLPYIPGLDLAGEVVEVGPGAGTFVPGDAVMAMADVKVGGGFGEYAVVRAGQAARRPANVSAGEGASLGVAAMTALQALRDWAKIPLGPKVEGFADAPGGGTRERSSGRVLVANASGGVGQYAVQLAKLAGEHVTATCGARNMEFVRALGADEVLDYRTPEGAALLSPSGIKYDVIVDGTTTLTWKQVAPVLSPSGMWLHLTPTPGIMASALFRTLTFSRQKVYPVLLVATAADFSILGRLSAEGLLRTHIDAEVPFEKAPDAWTKSAGGHVTGKVVVVRTGTPAPGE